MTKPIMKSSHLKVLASLIVSVAFLAGCKTTHKIADPMQPNGLGFDEIIEMVHKNQTSFYTFSAKFSANTKFKDSDYVFNGNLRIVKDSAIYISATLPIISEVARVVITPDSLKFLNRYERVFFVGEIGYLNKLLGAEVDYQMLEALLMGNDFVHFLHKNTFVTNHNNNFVVTSHARTPINNPFAKPLENRMWIDRESFRINQNIFMHEAENRMIRSTYKSFRTVQGQTIPVDFEMLFSEPSNSLFVSLELSRVTLDSPVSIAFSVPSGYRPMED